MKAVHAPRSQPARWLLALLALVVVAGIAIAATVLARSNDDAQQQNGATFVVAQGPLTISVSEAGTIKSREQAIIKSEVEGQNTILYLVQEGTRVKEGELLVELDVSQVADEKISQEIVVRNADAAALGARETLAVTISQAKSDNDKAELDYRFALLDLKKYMDGDYPNEVKAAESKISLSEEKVERAIEKYNWSQRLFGEKFLSDTELKADKLAMDEAKLSLELAKNELKLLKEYTFLRKKEELESMVVQTKDALERTIRKGKADIAQAQATTAAKEAELERQQSKLTKMNTMLSKSKMFAPTEGLVVYATTDGGRGGGFRFNQEPLAEGSTVRERQELIYLPTTASMMAATKVHESSLDKVRPGLPVRITVDALPGKTYTGRVAKIAPMPDSQNAWMNPDLKVYNTEIHIDGDGSELRTGMSCRTEIVVEWHENATYVPVQSVVRVGGQPTVYVQTEKGVAEPRTIELGLDNNRMAHVISGLQPGEQVLLNPPLQEAATNNEGPRPPDAFPAPTTQPTNDNGVRPTTRPTGFGDGMRGGPGGNERRQFSGEGREGGGDGEGRTGTGEARQGRRGGTMTPEQREARMKQFENMTPEQREAMRKQFEQRRGERGTGGEQRGTGTGGERQFGDRTRGGDDGAPGGAPASGAERPQGPRSN